MSDKTPQDKAVEDLDALVEALKNGPLENDNVHVASLDPNDLRPALKSYAFQIVAAWIESLPGQATKVIQDPEGNDVPILVVVPNMVMDLVGGTLDLVPELIEHIVRDRIEGGDGMDTFSMADVMARAKGEGKPSYKL